jgi:hypothetical protein
MASLDPRATMRGQTRNTYCEERAANCERLAATHTDISARKQLQTMAHEWRRLAGLSEAAG